MVPPTRRRLLHVAAAVTAGLAGCGGLTGEESSTSRSVTEGTDTIGSGPNGETNPESVLVRANTERAPIRIADDDDDETSTGSERPERRSIRLSHAVIATESTAERLVVADGVDREPIASFLSATDLDSETLYLETRRVDECFRLQLCAVAWADDEVRTEYGRRLRPYDERCVADRRVFESRLIRIPTVLDADEVRSYGSSTGERTQCSVDESADTERVGGEPATTNGPTGTGGHDDA